MGCTQLMCSNCKKNPANGLGGKCSRVNFGIPGIHYTPTFDFNVLDTKRTRSGYHTWKGHSDYKKCLEAPRGFCYSYFDVSQLESRTIAYFSRDPTYQGAYTSGKDCYIEAVRAAHPDFTDKQLKEYRPYGKVTLISAWYGSSAESCATSHSMDLYECETVMNGILDNWKVAASMREHKIQYVQNTGGMIETFLGDRLDGDATSAFTISLNYANQNSASNLAVEGFEHAVRAAGEYDVEITPVSVIHDSCQNLNPIKDLFETSIFYIKDFRGYCLAKYSVDLKVAIVYMTDQANDIEYSCKLPGKQEDYFWAPLGQKFTGDDTMEATFTGPIECVNKIIDQLFEFRPTAKDMGNGVPGVEIISDEVEEYPDPHYNEFMECTSSRPHCWINVPEFQNSGTRTVTLRVRDLRLDVLQHMKDPIEIPPMFMTDEQLVKFQNGEKIYADMHPENHTFDDGNGASGYYWQKVCTWDEHLYDPNTKSYYCKDPKKVYPAEEFIKQKKLREQQLIATRT